MGNPNSLRESQLAEIMDALEKESLLGEELTASEIYELVKDKGIGVESPHEVATILGHFSDESYIEVIDGSPYRYIIH